MQQYTSVPQAHPRPSASTVDVSHIDRKIGGGLPSDMAVLGTCCNACVTPRRAQLWMGGWSKCQKAVLKVSLPRRADNFTFDWTNCNQNPVPDCLHFPDVCVFGRLKNLRQFMRPGNHPSRKSVNSTPHTSHFLAPACAQINVTSTLAQVWRAAHISLQPIFMRS